ncbi:MAG: type II secretion system F family protein [Holosporales bacterium]|jgi:tight adherence protein B
MINTDTLILFSIIGGSLILIAFLLGMAKNQGASEQIQQRLKRKNTRKKQSSAEQTIIGDMPLTVVEGFAKNIGINIDSLRSRLKRADLVMTAQQVLFLQAGIGAAFTLLIMTFMQAPLIIAISIGLGMGILLPLVYIDKKAAARVDMFQKLFPDGLDIMVRGLRVGLPISECLRAVAKDAPKPVCDEFAKIRDDIRLGMPLRDAVLKTAEKIRTQEMMFFSMTISIQAESGGNLAENLMNLSTLLRKRQQVLRSIKAKSAEAVMTGKILGALPFIVLGALYFLAPDYVAVLTTTPKGQMIGGFCLIWMLIGIFMMRKMIRFDF